MTSDMVVDALISSEDQVSDLEEALQLICVKCRSNCWGPETPREDILNNLHDISSYALAGNMEKARELAKTDKG